MSTENQPHPQADVGAKAPVPREQPVLIEEHEDPKFWPPVKKCKAAPGVFITVPDSGTGICTGILVLMTATIAFCSSIYTAAIPSIASSYNCSSTVATLGITTFLLGFASGPLLFAPLSEVWSVSATAFYKRVTLTRSMQGPKYDLPVRAGTIRFVPDWLCVSPERGMYDRVSILLGLFWLSHGDKLRRLDHRYMAPEQPVCASGSVLGG